MGGGGAWEQRGSEADTPSKHWSDQAVIAIHTAPGRAAACSAKQQCSSTQVRHGFKHAHNSTARLATHCKPSDRATPSLAAYGAHSLAQWPVQEAEPHCAGAPQLALDLGKAALAADGPVIAQLQAVQRQAVTTPVSI